MTKRKRLKLDENNKLHSVVVDVLTGAGSTTEIAKRHKMRKAEVVQAVKDFSHVVLNPQMGELAIANSRMWTAAQMPVYNPSALVTRKGLSIFDEMRKDDQIKAALWFKKLAAVSSGWEVVSPEGEDETYKPTKFLKNELGSLIQPLDQIVSTGILSALDFGFSISEVLFRKIDTGEFSGLIGISNIKTRAPHDISFKMDKFGNLEKDGIIQSTPDGPKSLPPNKFILYAYQSEFSNPYGRSDLEAAYSKWWVKENAYRWLAMLLERFGIPPIFALYDPSSMNPSQVTALRTAIERIQAATAGALPRASKDSLELWAPELAGQTGRVFIPALEMLNRDISRALLMPGLMGLSPDAGVGSYARARVEFDVFVLMLEYLRKQVAGVMNHQLIGPLSVLNFGMEPNLVPEFKFLPLTDDLRLEMFNAWTNFVAAQIVKPTIEDEIHVRKAFGFPTLSKESKADRERAPVAPPPDDGGNKEKKTEPEPEPDPGSDLEDKIDEDFTDAFGSQDQPRDKEDVEPSHYYRTKTRFEKEVDFKQIEDGLDTLEAKTLKELVPELKAVRDRFLKFVETKFDHDAGFVRDLKELRGLTAVSDKVYAFLLDAYDLGSKIMARDWGRSCN